ncbi:hypothetical protein CTI12_AA586400 [Artemisia annua]|uniref:Uncharacterized protein n=1 Tax=Artemisia annua TaxID=35608 RepID=A0A2U1KN32_ARTAN|nr:hypothetical protein CTI12_AA586400 [Artemisia annua]
MFTRLQAEFGDNSVSRDAQLVYFDDEPLCKPSFQVVPESMHNKADAEVCGQVMESPLTENVNKEQEIGHDSLISKNVEADLICVLVDLVK